MRPFLALFTLVAGLALATVQSDHRARVRVYTDSIRAETCRGGTWSGSVCNGRKWAPRLTYLRRYANAIDGIEATDTAVTPPPDTVVPPPDTTPPPDTVTPPPDTTTPPPPPDTTTPPPPPPDTLLRAPELPRAVPSYPVDLGTRPCTVRPVTLAELQSAVNAVGARVICLPTGLTLTGWVDIPARAASDTGWSVIRADTTVTVGQRLTGLERLPKLVASPDTRFPVLWFHAKAAKWLVQGVEITTDTTPTTPRLALVEVGERVAPTSLADLPRDIHFSHVNLHGWLTVETKVGFYLGGIGHVVRDSRCTEIHQRNADNQCLLAINAPGPFLYENDLIEAASENIMFGGGDPKIVGLIPSDATIRGNLIRKPVAWRAIGTPTQSGSYLVKLLIEAKNAQRVLVERNRLEGSWLDGQTGYAIGLKSVNQEGACRWCRVTDWTIRENTIVNVGAGFGFAGRPELHPVDTALSRVLVTRNWIDSLNVAPNYVGDARGILLGWQASDIAFVRNTWAGGNWSREAVILATDAADKMPSVTRFRFDENVMPTGQFGFGAGGIGEGLTALNSPAVAGGWSFTGNTFIGAPRNNYPVTTRFAPDLASAIATGAGIPAPPVGSPAPPPPPPPPDTTTPPPPPPSGKVVQLDPSRTFQTISGWEMQGNDGWLECPGYLRYRDEVHRRLANEVGINRVRLELRSGTENDQDYFTLFRQGTITRAAWRATWFRPINDNADPFTTDPARYHWSYLDAVIDNVVTPMRAQLAARGERLYVLLTVVDFLNVASRPFEIIKSGEEYAELVTLAFQHIEAKYGWVPDGLEVTLEPEHSQAYPVDLGRAIVAASARLEAAGHRPEIYSPATTSMLNGHTYHDQMLAQVPASRGRFHVLSYHRYTGVSDSSLRAIGARVARDGVRTAMLEHIDSGIDDLYADLTVGLVSAWQQFTGAFCSQIDNTDDGSVYLQVNVSDSLAPRVNLTTRSAQLSQVFRFVRSGAVRVGATSGDTALRPLAFRTTNGAFVVTVRTNGGATFTVRGLPPGTYTITHALDGSAVTTTQSTLVKSDAGDVQVSIPGAGVLTVAGR